MNKDKLTNFNAQIQYKLIEELAFQNKEKEQRAAELTIANEELVFQNEEKQKRANELAIANTELAFQNEEKQKRANELTNIRVELEQQIACLNEAAIVSEADSDGNITFVNDKFCEISGYKREELIGKNYKILRSPSQPQSFYIDLWVVILSGRVWKGQQMSVKKGGKDFYYTDTTITPFKDSNGKIIKFVGIQFDITAEIKLKETLLSQADELFVTNKELVFQNEEKQKRADELVIANKELAFQNKEKEKRAAELTIANKELAFQNKEKLKRANELAIVKELRQFIETANTPIIGLDAKGLINEWNEGAEKITGYKKEEVLGSSWIKYTPINSEEGVRKIFNQSLKGKQTGNNEFSTTSKDGKEVILLVNTSTRIDNDGIITGMLAVGLDITELVSYRNELEVKVEERTIKLNKALENQKELSELKTKFVSTASHEFRTPLSAINFAAGYIKKYGAKIAPSIINKKLNKIEDQVLHMTQLLDDILIVGQADAGKMRNNPVSINLGDFIHDIIEEVSSSSKESHEIELIDAEDLKSTAIFIDEKLGRNIFVNLLSNATKFSPNAKKVTIELSSEKGYILFSITDLGIGIPKSEFKNIFVPFNRGKNVDLIQGTGLGLSIVKAAVDVLGGKIMVNSNANKGTTFTVKIPKR